MNKIFLVIVSMCGFLFFSACTMKNTVKIQPFPASATPRLAILPFESSNPYLPGNLFSDYFTVFFNQNINEFQLVERCDVLRIMKEQKTGSINVADRISKLDFISDLDAVLVGSVQTLNTLQSNGGTISVVVKVIKVPSGKVIWADREKISSILWTSSKQVEEVAEDLIEKSARKMALKIKKNLDPRSLDDPDMRERFSVIRKAKLEMPTE